MVTGTTNGDDQSVQIKGQAPLSELIGYQSRLNALTAGQGRYEIQHSHYEAVPPTVQQHLMSSFKAHDDD
jgi:elongation factor G